jgi:hypothetical protein
MTPPRCPPTCARKRGHATEDEARHALAHMMLTRPLESEPRVYQCPYCKLWYLGRWREFRVEGVEA